MGDEANSEAGRIDNERQELDWEFINWDIVPGTFAHNVFFASQFDSSGRSWGVTLTFTASPPPTDQPRHTMRAVAQDRITIPIGSFKNMVDFVLANYESVFGEDLPEIGETDEESAGQQEQ